MVYELNSDTGENIGQFNASKRSITSLTLSRGECNFRYNLLNLGTMFYFQKYYANCYISFPISRKYTISDNGCDNRWKSMAQ